MFNHLYDYTTHTALSVVITFFICSLDFLHSRQQFFIKRDSESLTDEEMPDFLQALQQLGMTLETYNGAYNNNTHSHALECTRQFNECEGLQQESPPAKRAKVGEGTSATPAE